MATIENCQTITTELTAENVAQYGRDMCSFHTYLTSNNDNFIDGDGNTKLTKLGEMKQMGWNVGSAVVTNQVIFDAYRSNQYALGAIDFNTKADLDAYGVPVGFTTARVKHGKWKGIYYYENSAWVYVEKPTTPEMFGAIGDGVADDTQACLDWAQYGRENHLVLEGTKGSKYRITQGLWFANATTSQSINGLYGNKAEWLADFNGGVVFSFVGIQNAIRPIIKECNLTEYNGSIQNYGMLFARPYRSTTQVYSSGNAIVERNRLVGTYAGAGICCMSSESNVIANNFVLNRKGHCISYQRDDIYQNYPSNPDDPLSTVIGKAFGAIPLQYSGGNITSTFGECRGNWMQNQDITGGAKDREVMTVQSFSDIQIIGNNYNHIYAGGIHVRIYDNCGGLKFYRNYMHAMHKISVEVTTSVAWGGGTQTLSGLEVLSTLSAGNVQDTRFKVLGSPLLISCKIESDGNIDLGTARTESNCEFTMNGRNADTFTAGGSTLEGVLYCNSDTIINNTVSDAGNRLTVKFTDSGMNKFPPRQLKAISSGAITIPQARKIILVATEGGASSDDLTHINFTNAPSGDIFFLRVANGAKPITIKMTGNITGTADVVMNSTAQYVMCTYDENINKTVLL